MEHSEFEQHPVHLELEKLRSTVKEALDTESGKDGGLEVNNLLIQLEAALSYIDARLKSTFVEVVTKTALDNMHGGITRAAQALTRGPSKVQVATSALTDLTNMQSTVSDLPQVETEHDLEAVRKASHSLRDWTKAEIGKLATLASNATGELNEVKQKASALEAQVAALKARNDEVVDRLQTQFSESQHAMQTGFTEKQAARAEEFAAELASQADSLGLVQKQCEEAVAAFKTTYEEALGKQRNRSDEVLQQLEAELEKAKNIVGVIAGTGMSGAYQQHAEYERKRAEYWSYGVIAAIVAVLGVVFFGPSMGQGGNVDWAGLFARTGALAGLGLIATYAARQSKMHRASERPNKLRQMALESVLPFVDDLSAEDQVEIKKRMAEELFSAKSVAVEDAAGDLELPQARLLGMAEDLLKRIPKS